MMMAGPGTDGFSSVMSFYVWTYIEREGDHAATLEPRPLLEVGNGFGYTTTIELVKPLARQRGFSALDRSSRETNVAAQTLI